jgi:hypothetical protein
VRRARSDYDGKNFTAFRARSARSAVSVADFEGAPIEPASEEERLIIEFRDYLNENSALIEQGRMKRSTAFDMGLAEKGDEDLDTLLRMLDEEIDKW